MRHENEGDSVIRPSSSFEQVVHDLKLQPEQYLGSAPLREWARRNKDSKFIPESLLQAWGFDTAQKLPNRVLIRHKFRLISRLR